MVDKDDTEDVDDDDERVSLDQTHECLRCADLQEEIRITDEKVEAKAKETEDVHEKQILEIKRRHEEELGSLKRENAALSRRILQFQNDEREMRRQIDFLSGVVRKAEKRTAVPSQTDKPTKPSDGTSVTKSVARIIGEFIINIFLKL